MSNIETSGEKNSQEHVQSGHSEHRHPGQPDIDDNMTYYKTMEYAVRHLLINKGYITAAQIHDEIEKMDARTPVNGANIVARAWLDSHFKKLLLSNPKRAIEEFGHNIGPMNLIVLENTPKVHNVVVCTLCSCYPRWILGLPPDWYKSSAYRARVVKEPRSVLREFGTVIDPKREVRVHDSTADMRYMVLPMRPTGTSGMSSCELSSLVGRDSMIGVAEVKFDSD